MSAPEESSAAGTNAPARKIRRQTQRRRTDRHSNLVSNDNDNLASSNAVKLLKHESHRSRFANCDGRGWNVLRRRIKWVLETTTFGLAVDLGNVLLSILACAIYVCQVESPNVQSENLANADIGLTVWFIFDYCLRIIIADNMLEAMLSREYISDFVSILPGLIEFIPETGGSEGLQVLRLLRILKVLRLLRIQRLLLYFGDNEVAKQIFFMTLVLVFCVFFFSGLYHFVENLPGAFQARYIGLQDAGLLDENLDLSWHDLTDDEQKEAELSYLKYGFGTAAYFVVVTMTTVGYGDYSPSTGLAEAVACIMIIVAVVVVSFETNQLMTTISDQSVYKNRKYTVRPRRVHVLLVGAVNSNGVRNFIEEFFNADQLFMEDTGRSIDIVFMAPCSPAQDILDLLEEPQYALNLHYIAGSVLSARDLKRAAAGHAQAIWCFADKFDRETASEADSLMILRAINVHRFVSSFPEQPPLYVQLSLPENVTKFVLGREDDSISVTCLDEMKMNMLARSFSAPGCFTLFNNLCTSADVPSYGKGEHPPLWLREYHEGFSQEIYRIMLSRACNGVNFQALARAAYDEFKIVVIAVEEGGVIQVSPNDYTINCDKEPYVYVIASCAADAELLTSEESDLDVSSHTDKSNVLTTPVKRVELTSTTKMPLNTASAKSHRRASSTFTDPRSALGIVGSAVKHILKSGDSDDANFSTTTTFLRDNYYICEKRRSFEDGHINSIQDVVSSTPSSERISGDSQGHLILVGSVDVRNLVLQLRSKHYCSDDSIVPIVMIVPPSYSEEMWKSISIFPQVFFLFGNALNTEDLLRAGVMFASTLIVFPDAGNSRQKLIDSSNPAFSESLDTSSATELYELQTMADADTIFINSTAKGLNPNISILSELVYNANLFFLNDVHVHASEGGGLTKKAYDSTETYPWFAEGNVYLSSMNDYMSAQLFHNPFIATLIEKIIVASWKPTASSTIIELINPFLDSKTGEPSTANAPGARWGEVFDFITFTGAIPVALYRGKPENHHEASEYQNELPYVFTNPNSQAIVRKQDRVFILVQSHLAWKQRIYGRRHRRETFSKPGKLNGVDTDGGASSNDQY